tara:strand:+ start:538 stop:777 length:240 start_codon:yes stop_codon:yes gene_type:complete
MGNYLDNENQDSADDTPEVRQVRQGVRQVRQSDLENTVKPLPLLEKPGDPGRTRTYNPRLRRPVLYPVELRGLAINHNS